MIGVCFHCFQEFDIEKRNLEARRRKSQNAKNMMIKAKARGSIIGRPKMRDDAAIRALRATGLTLREIAFRLKISIGKVQRGIKNV